MDRSDDNDRPGPPQETEFQTDIAVEIVRKITVIPPSGVKYPVQQPAGRQFHRCREKHPENKQDQHLAAFRNSAARCSLEPVQDTQKQQHTEAVDRADRSVQKSPVDHQPQ